VRYPILALLADQPAHGYELKQAFDDRFGAVWPPINAGQIYNTLAALERDNLVRGQDVPQRGAPSRRVYELTDEGRAAFEGWIREPSASPKLKEEFIVKLVLAHIAGTVDPMILIDRQRQEYFKTMRELNDLATRHDGDPSTQVLIGGASLYVEALLKWMDLCEQVLGTRSSPKDTDPAAQPRDGLAG
jgi:DNA-binding PadR family transcriptional regulator